MTTALAIAILVLAFLAAVHFILETVVVPSQLLRLRYQVFALRDRLRRLKSEDPALTDEVFRNLEDKLNGCVNILPYLTVSVVVRVEAQFANNPELSAQAEAGEKLLRLSPVAEAREIRGEVVRILTRAIQWNCLGLMIYGVPLYLAWMWVYRLFKAIDRMASLPSQDMNRLTPGLGCKA